MAKSDSTPLERSLALLNEALTTGIRGHNREAVASAIEVLEDNGRSGLTDLHYKNCPVGKTLTDPQRPGLWMRNNKTGPIWLFNPTEGKPVVIGTYPAMSVIEARQEWQAMRTAIRAGENPTAKPVLLTSAIYRCLDPNIANSMGPDSSVFVRDARPALAAQDGPSPSFKPMTTCCAGQMMTHTFRNIKMPARAPTQITG